MPPYQGVEHYITTIAIKGYIPGCCGSYRAWSFGLVWCPCCGDASRLDLEERFFLERDDCRSLRI